MNIKIPDICDFVGVIQAYLDESFAHGNRQMIVVGGAIANKSSWLSLSVQWNAVLNKYGVSAFHSTDYNNKEEEFRGWELEKRHSFIDSLFKIMESERLQARAIIFEKSDFDRAIINHPKIRLTDYQFACFSCVQHLSTDKVSPIEVIFEHGNKFHNPFMDAMIEASQIDKMFFGVYGISAITRVKKEGVRPLEVADFVIYELGKAHTRVVTGHPIEPRYQAVKFNKIMKGKATKLSYEKIEKYLSIMEKNIVEE